MSPALAGGFLTTAPPGKSQAIFKKHSTSFFFYAELNKGKNLKCIEELASKKGLLRVKKLSKTKNQRSMQRTKTGFHLEDFNLTQLSMSFHS